MAILDELVSQIEDPTLRTRIATEVEKLAKQKKFGLVFEEHLPECTPLWDIPVKKGSKVALKAGAVSDFYTVLKIEDGVALCLNKDKSATEEFAVKDLVSVAEFGEAIFPYLKPIDSVCNAPDSDLWHTLIEADNYHALQLLEYLYAGKVDCIYIDPPYNTGARDWKYNNDYVDNNDQYRHSKWLSMMQKRLRIAKKLLNPNDSVLIVTIDEKEYLHLGCLLEEMFPEAKLQMISTVNAHASTARLNEFNRNNEFIYFVMLGSYKLEPIADSKSFSEGDVVNWRTLRRGDLESKRGTSKGGKAQFYPIYVNAQTGKIEHLGCPLSPEMPIDSVEQIPGCIPVFPIRDDGTEMNWGLTIEALRDRLNKGYAKAGKYQPDKPQKYPIQYLQPASIKSIEEGTVKITGYNPDGSVIAVYDSHRKVLPKTQWDDPLYDARDYGTRTLKALIGDRFDFPKSLYAVRDCVKLFVAGKPNALILDFFAGSGTTLHAVNLLNAEDGGHRRCILVTNNEVSDSESKEMTARGLKPGDEEWDNLGIARFVTWPRTVCSIKGHDINGIPLKGNYVGSEIPMADGFKTNAVFFKLGFLDKNAIALGRQFKEMLPTLWMKSGAYGPCPTVEEAPSMLILPENRFAVLVDEKQYLEFSEKIETHPEIETVFIVTDSESGYRDMISGLDVKESYQLYRDYLDNFRINAARR